MIRTKHPRGTGAWLVFVRCQETRDNGDSRQVSNPVRIRCGLAWTYSKQGQTKLSRLETFTLAIVMSYHYLSALLFVLCSDNMGEYHSKSVGSGSMSLTMSDHVWVCGSYYIKMIGLNFAWHKAVLPRKGIACKLRPMCFTSFRQMNFYALLVRKPVALHLPLFLM